MLRSLQMVEALASGSGGEDKEARKLAVLARVREMGGMMNTRERDEVWDLYRKFVGNRVDEGLKKVQCFDGLARVAVTGEVRHVARSQSNVPDADFDTVSNTRRSSLSG